MTHDPDHSASEAAETPPDALQGAALSAIAGLRTLLDLAERVARDPQGAARVVTSLASFAKMAFEQIGEPAASAAAPTPVPTTAPTAPDAPDAPVAAVHGDDDDGADF